MTLLPQPELADDAQGLAWEEIEAGAIDRADDAFILDEVRFEIAHGEQRYG